MQLSHSQSIASHAMLCLPACVSVQIASDLHLPCSSSVLVYIKQGANPADRQVQTYDSSDPTLAVAMQCSAMAAVAS